MLRGQTHPNVSCTYPSLVLIVVVDAGFGFDEKGRWKEMDEHSIVTLGVCRDELT